MTRLRDHTWQESFTSSQGNLLEGFYRPALLVYWAEWLTLAPGARVPVGLPVGSGAPEARPLTVQWTAAEHTHSGVTRQGSQRSDESVGAGAGSSRGMNAAYAFQAAELVGLPPLAVPYQAAGFEALARELIACTREQAGTGDPDREMIDAWAEKLGIARWYSWQPAYPAEVC